MQSAAAPWDDRFLRSELPRVALEVCTAARKRAQEVNRRIAPLVDVMLGNEEDFSAALGFEVPGMDETSLEPSMEGFKQMIESRGKEFSVSGCRHHTCAKRTPPRTTIGARSAMHGGIFYEANHAQDLEIFDRVGGGDSFASGLIYGFLAGKDPQWAVECGAAHGALAMTTPGDTTMATLKEVMQLMRGAGARIAR